MQSFNLEITNYQNQAMSDNPDFATAQILREVADRVQSGDQYGSIRDYNGNTVGEWSFTEEY